MTAQRTMDLMRNLHSCPCWNGEKEKAWRMIEEPTPDQAGLLAASVTKSSRGLTENQDLDLALIEPGKPWQNGLNESFNGKFRDECLSMEWLRCRAEARVVIEEWRLHYNSVRPNSSLNNMTPEHFCQ